MSILSRRLRTTCVSAAVDLSAVPGLRQSFHWTSATWDYGNHSRSSERGRGGGYVRDSARGGGYARDSGRPGYTGSSRGGGRGGFGASRGGRGGSNFGISGRGSGRGGSFGARGGRPGQDFVAGRRKLTDIDSLGRGGRTEIARDSPPHAGIQPREEEQASESYTRRSHPERSFRSEPRPSLTSPPSGSITTQTTPQAPFYRPKEQLDYASTLSSSEFSTPSTLVTMGTSSLANTLREAPKSFTSSPLLPGLVSALDSMLKPTGDTDAMPKPTPIQQLSLKWILGHVEDEERPFEWGQWLLAAETGSGKSFAYLLPMLQALKQSEGRARIAAPAAAAEESAVEGEEKQKEQPLPLNPRAIILAPTHELSRQISSFSKSLLYNVKLRVLCASKNNSDIKSFARTSSTVDIELTRGTLARKLSSRDMAHILGDSPTSSLSEAQEDAEGTQEVSIPRTEDSPTSHPVDVVVGTPMKIMDMVRGRWWDLKPGELGGTGRELDRFSKTKSTEREGGRMERAKTQGRPEMGLANVEWVIIDEADVLLDPDFQEVTRTLLADIAAARGEPIKLDAFPFSSSSRGAPIQPPSPSTSSTSPAPAPAKENTNAESLEYPFNLVLSSATIPFSLSRYLDLYHPRLMRLVSPRLHCLPESLKVEYVKWTGGNRFVDVERRVREVWAGDAVEAGVRRGASSPLDIATSSSASTSSVGGQKEKPELSKVLIFCNKSSKVDELSKYLEEKGIKTVAVTSGRDRDGGVRTRGSNKYLQGFLRPIGSAAKRPAATANDEGQVMDEGKKKLKNPYMLSDPSETPHVLLTTSLLSRGLDFDPSIRHVFIVDEPRNMVDFIHRAGRSGRTGGQGGKVVIFGRSGSSSNSSTPYSSALSSSPRTRNYGPSSDYSSRRGSGEDRFRVTRERLNLGARQTGAGGGMHEAVRRMEREKRRSDSSSGSGSRFSRR